MLFNSFEFIFLYLPAVYTIYFFMVRFHISESAQTAWLGIASVFFYAFGAAQYLHILLLSILFNFVAGIAINAAPPGGRRRGLTAAAVTANLFTLGYFKYNGFLLSIISGDNSASGSIADLPIGISFFTFTQIAFLIDFCGKKDDNYSFRKYLLFVTYFPHLIAGPILHHAEMIPQFGRQRPTTQMSDLAIGTTIFLIGLFKKVILADAVAPASTAIFTQAQIGHAPGFVDAWVGALSYTLQIYFDFSAYSDMAIGISRMFGIALPINFASPYKAASIIDFWRRWHITLSRFLRDYLYISLGGGRRGRARRYINLLVTMLLGGLWHGAGWTFILWGGLHGGFLAVNHAWKEIFKDRLRFPRWLGLPLTLLCVIVAWVPFRAANLQATLSIWAGMIGLNGGTTMLSSMFPTVGLIIVLFGIALLAPNVQQMFAAHTPGLPSPGYPDTAPAVPRRLTWRPSLPVALASAVVLLACVMKLNDISEFIYFQF